MSDEAHDRISENLAAYVLESLEEPERVQLEAHVPRCATCAQRLHEYRAVVGSLPAGHEPVAPPAAAWASIQAAVRQGRHRRGAWKPARSRLDWLRGARWPAAAVLVTVLLTWNVALQRELTRRTPGPAPGPEVEALSRRPGRLIILAGTGRPGASARIFVAVDGGGHLAISGLPQLPRERTYQLWFIRSRETFSGATFGVDGSGRAWAKVTVPVSLEDVAAIAVTEEPTPGSVAPTGPRLLEARREG